MYIAFMYRIRIYTVCIYIYTWGGHVYLGRVLLVLPHVAHCDEPQSQVGQP